MKAREREWERERERERSSQKENGIWGMNPEHGHFVCLVPHGDTRCMGAAMRIIANAGTPLSDSSGVGRGWAPANLLGISRSFHHQLHHRSQMDRVRSRYRCCSRAYEINADTWRDESQTDVSTMRHVKRGLWKISLRIRSLLNRKILFLLRRY